MLEIFKNKKIQLILKLIGLVLTFEFIIAPGLTKSNTLINIISALIALWSLIYLYQILDIQSIFKKENKKNKNDRN